MKKTLIAVAAAAALTTSAFAEITFGAWLRALAAPVASDGQDTVVSMGNSWGWGARVARLNVNATAEDGKIGYNMCIAANADNSIGNVADTVIWAKPIDSVKVSFGCYDYPLLRGDCAYGSWNWLRPEVFAVSDDEGLLMTGLNNTDDNTGVLVEATPTDALFAYVHVPIPADSSLTKATKAEDAYKNARAGVSYNIEGTGKIKAQYIGMGDDKRLEAEFDLSAVENLWVGVGFGMNMWDKEDLHSADEKMKIGLGVTYQVNDDLKVYANGAYRTCVKGKDDLGHDGRFQAGVGADYNLGDGLTLNADVRYLAKEDDVDNTDRMAFSAGVTKGISSNGYIGVAFQGQTNSGTWATNVIKGQQSDEGKSDRFTWCVPVVISCWF